jgi:hypothetical protein
MVSLAPGPPGQTTYIVGVSYYTNNINVYVHRSNIVFSPRPTMVPIFPYMGYKPYKPYKPYISYIVWPV